MAVLEELRITDLPFEHVRGLGHATGDDLAVLEKPRIADLPLMGRPQT